jgi:hypothetical protein
MLDDRRGVFIKRNLDYAGTGIIFSPTDPDDISKRRVQLDPERVPSIFVKVNAREVTNADVAEALEILAETSARTATEPLNISQDQAPSNRIEVRAEDPVQTLLSKAIHVTYAMAKVYLDRAVSDSEKPPRAATFLLLLIPPKSREGIMGDLEEEFRTILLPEYGLRMAQFYYWWHSILTCLSFALGAFGALSKVIGIFSK